MYFELYDYITGNAIGRVNKLTFGDITQNQHCINPLVFRAFFDEISINSLKIYLENKGSADTEYGYYTSPLFESSIESGSQKLSNHFIEVPDASSTSPGGVSIGWDINISDWIWFDVQISENSGISEPNFRFIYNWI